MKHQPILVTLAIVGLLTCGACGSFSGAHRPESAVVPPSQVVDFNALYGQNCAGCHGVGGKGGAAIALANPVFLAIADDTAIRLRHPMQRRLPAMRNVAPTHIERTAPLVMERTDMEGTRLARSWMVRTLLW